MRKKQTNFQKKDKPYQHIAGQLIKQAGKKYIDQGI
jgi:hypothetical protein